MQRGAWAAAQGDSLPISAPSWPQQHQQRQDQHAERGGWAATPRDTLGAAAGVGWGDGPAGPTWQHQQHQQPLMTEALAPHEDDRLRAVRDLPPALQPLFSFRYFNPVQSETFDAAYCSDANLVVSAPTGSGKTGVMELAMLRLISTHMLGEAPGARRPGGGPLQQRQLQQQQQQRQLQQQQQQRPAPLGGRRKVVYLGPIKALVQERHADWAAHYGGVLGLRVVQLTGDVDDEGAEGELEAADVICSTPEKFDQVTRKLAQKGLGFFAEIALLLVDEVHLLNEAGRGSSLEAGCVCRVKAVAAFPEMAQAPIASVRFVAVSATIPNIGDLAAWLRVPPEGVRQYGDELRPCKLTTHVKGYAQAKNEFMFNKRLDEFVFGIVASYSSARPALVFCNSRKGTMDSAAVLAKAAASPAAPTGSSLVRSQPQLARLQAAASAAQARALAAALPAGVGFHHAGMEPADRALVEELFKAGDLAALCTTSTLALGVNLPAHLVVVKGTSRYVGDAEAAPGEAAGYREYSATEMLQMVGRAGRPQFDTEGVAVIMTQREHTARYQQLLAGQPVESCLMSHFAEHLNAEVALGTVKDVPGAIAWLKSSFLFTRLRANPCHYGLKVRPGAGQAELDGLLRDQLVLRPVAELLRLGLLSSDEDGFALTSTAAGRLMAAHFLRLRTMAAIVGLGDRPSMPSLLRVVCGAEEFRGTSLRRCEKRPLNELNHSADPAALRYHVAALGPDGAPTGKPKERVSTPQEKLFLLLNDALADKPAEGLDYSLKQEQERLLVVGQRIAKCMAKLYALRSSFSAAGRSLLLARSLRLRLWDDSGVSVRQLPSVGRVLGARLAAAGLGSLRALAACNNAHQVEVAAQKPYPWGSELLASLRTFTPPTVSLQLEVLERLPKGALSCQLTVSRLGQHQGGGSGAAAQRHASHTPAKLLCGCGDTDELLLLRSLVLETFESPLRIAFRVRWPPCQGSARGPVSISARLVLDRVIGLDEKASLSVAPAAGWPWAGSAEGAGSAAAGPEPEPGQWAGQAAPEGSAPAAPWGTWHGGGDAQLHEGAEEEAEAAGSRAAAAAALQPRQRKRPRPPAAAHTEAPGNGSPQGGAGAAAAAAAKQLCASSRQHNAPAPASPRLVEEGAPQVPAAAGLGAPDNAAVAARYLGVLQRRALQEAGGKEAAATAALMAAGAEHRSPGSGGGGWAALTAPRPGDGAPAAAAVASEAAAAAVDAGSVQITPERSGGDRAPPQSQQLTPATQAASRLAAHAQPAGRGACASPPALGSAPPQRRPPQLQRAPPPQQPASQAFAPGGGGSASLVSSIFDLLAEEAEGEGPAGAPHSQPPAEQQGQDQQQQRMLLERPQPTCASPAAAAKAAPTLSSSFGQQSLSSAASASSVFSAAVLAHRQALGRSRELSLGARSDLSSGAHNPMGVSGSMLASDGIVAQAASSQLMGGGAGGGTPAFPRSSAAPPAAGGRVPTAAYLPGSPSGDLCTPPRQVVRSGFLAPPQQQQQQQQQRAGADHASCRARWGVRGASAAQSCRPNLAASGSPPSDLSGTLQLPLQAPLRTPLFQEFAFGGPPGPAVAAAYRPSATALMFQQRRAAAPAVPAATRAGAGQQPPHAVPAATRGAAGRRRQPAAAVGVWDADSGDRAGWSGAGAGGGAPFLAGHAPAAPRPSVSAASWGSFVAEPEQRPQDLFGGGHRRGDAARRARATWQASAGGAGALRLQAPATSASASMGDWPEAAAAAAVGRGGANVLPPRLGHTASASWDMGRRAGQELPAPRELADGSPRPQGRPAPPAAAVPPLPAVAVAGDEAAALPAGPCRGLRARGGAAGAEPSTGAAAAAPPPAAAAPPCSKEDKEDDGGLGGMEFGGLFDFMRS